MPELPEVATIAADLQKVLPEKIISRVKITENKMISPPRAVFLRLIKGQRIVAAQRRGKHLLIKLGKGNLLIHLKMTGQLIYSSELKSRKNLGRNLGRN